MPACDRIDRRVPAIDIGVVRHDDGPRPGLGVLQHDVAALLVIDVKPEPDEGADYLPRRQQGDLRHGSDLDGNLGDAD